MCCYPPQAAGRRAKFGQQCSPHSPRPSQRPLALRCPRLPGFLCPPPGCRPSRLSHFSPLLSPSSSLSFASTHSLLPRMHLILKIMSTACLESLSGGEVCKLTIPSPSPHSVLSPHTPGGPVWTQEEDRPKSDRSRTVGSGQVGLSPLSPTRCTLLHLPHPSSCTTPMNWNSWVQVMQGLLEKGEVIPQPDEKRSNYVEELMYLNVAEFMYLREKCLGPPPHTHTHTCFFPVAISAFLLIHPVSH